VLGVHQLEEPPVGGQASSGARGGVACRWQQSNGGSKSVAGRKGCGAYEALQSVRLVREREDWGGGVSSKLQAGQQVCGRLPGCGQAARRSG
jgi:hypothetical protein